jgi:hypothetical protein
VERHELHLRQLRDRPDLRDRTSVI